MNRFRKKPVVVEATRWFKMGDHPAVTDELTPYYYEAWNAGLCEHCGEHWMKHGWVKTLEGGHVVCPGDWIITGVKGERYPCKPDIFATTYETVEEIPH